MKNLFFDAECALIDNTLGKGGLGRYTQTHCKCTVENGAFHIVRDSGYTGTTGLTYGGLAIGPASGLTADNGPIIQSGHTYEFLVDVSGYTHNAITYSTFCLNAGWISYAGLTRKPTGEVRNVPQADFEGTMTAFYRFTADEPIKTATLTQSDAVSGNTYDTYRYFYFGFHYGDTTGGGTDLYLTNIRLYDITDKLNSGIHKDGVFSVGQILEDRGKASINKSGEVWSNQIYEI